MTTRGHTGVAKFTVQDKEVTLTEVAESEQLLAFANTLADHAAQTARRYFKTTLTIDSKADETPVTIADRKIERMLREMIATQYPHHGVVGEEEEDSRSQSEWVWVLDPIDGTQSFVSGVPLFGCLLALAADKVPYLGVLEIPALQERWVAIDGAETKFNGEHCTTRDVADLGKAIMLTTSVEMFTAEEAKRYGSLRQRVRYVRHGTDCYGYGLLASGHVNLVVESDLKPFDYMALVPVVTGAGGCISDWQGRPLTLSSGTTNVVAAASEQLHRQALGYLSE